MFCKKCGNEIGQNERFCPKCGTPVDIVDSQDLQYSAGYANQNAGQSPGVSVSPGSIGFFQIVCLASAAAAILQLILWFVNCVSGSIYGYTIKVSMNNMCTGFGVLLTIITVLLCLISVASSVFSLIYRTDRVMPVPPIVTGAWCLLLYVIKAPRAFNDGVNAIKESFSGLGSLESLGNLIDIDISITFGGILYIIVSITLIALGITAILKSKKS